MIMSWWDDLWGSVSNTAQNAWDTAVDTATAFPNYFERGKGYHNNNNLDWWQDMFGNSENPYSDTYKAQIVADDTEKSKQFLNVFDKLKKDLGTKTALDQAQKYGVDVAPVGPGPAGLIGSMTNFAYQNNDNDNLQGLINDADNILESKRILDENIDKANSWNNTSAPLYRKGLSDRHWGSDKPDVTATAKLFEGLGTPVELSGGQYMPKTSDENNNLKYQFDLSEEELKRQNDLFNTYKDQIYNNIPLEEKEKLKEEGLNINNFDNQHYLIPDKNGNIMAPSSSISKALDIIDTASKYKDNEDVLKRYNTYYKDDVPNLLDYLMNLTPQQEFENTDSMDKFMQRLFIKPYYNQKYNEALRKDGLDPSEFQYGYYTERNKYRNNSNKGKA